MGNYTKANAELCLLAMREHIKSIDKKVPQVLMHPRQGHSVKPQEIMKRIDSLFGPTTSKMKLNYLQDEKLKVGIDGAMTPGHRMGIVWTQE